MRNGMSMAPDVARHLSCCAREVKQRSGAERAAGEKWRRIFAGFAVANPALQDGLHSPLPQRPDVTIVRSVSRSPGADMHHAPPDPRSVTDIRPSPPVTQVIRAMRREAQDATVVGDERGLPAAQPGRNGGGRLMRRMLIAAAIASGLVALWALLVPLVA
jgi:hypothetical protein